MEKSRSWETVKIVDFFELKQKELQEEIHLIHYLVKDLTCEKLDATIS